MAVETAVEPRCPVFKACGGCAYQDRSYPDELALKEREVTALLTERAGLRPDAFDSIVASPSDYGYRHRLDLTFKRTKNGPVMGFSTQDRFHVLEIGSCPIAREEVSSFIPRLRREAEAKIPPEYRTASLVVKTGDDGRVRWGGIGRRSLELEPEDYLWTEILGRRVHYSLDTFFQSNLGILPLVFGRLDALVDWDSVHLLGDLYGGVGLFSVVLAPRVRRVVLVESYGPSVRVARHNFEASGIWNGEIREGRVEDRVAELDLLTEGKKVYIVDPPRAGLGLALEALARSRADVLLYLSCNPESLAEDLRALLDAGWRAERVIPFDFFPRTRHVETLVKLTR